MIHMKVDSTIIHVIQTINTDDFTIVEYRSQCCDTLYSAEHEGFDEEKARESARIKEAAV